LARSTPHLSLPLIASKPANLASISSIRLFGASYYHVVCRVIGAFMRCPPSEEDRVMTRQYHILLQGKT
jgi:hypothetical protein